MTDIRDPWLEFIKDQRDYYQRILDDSGFDENGLEASSRIAYTRREDSPSAYFASLHKYVRLADCILAGGTGDDDRDEALKDAYLLGESRMLARVLERAVNAPSNVVRLTAISWFMEEVSRVASRDQIREDAAKKMLAEKNAKTKPKREARDAALCKELKKQLKIHNDETDALQTTLSHFNSEVLWKKFSPAPSIDVKQFRTIARERKIIPPAIKKK